MATARATSAGVEKAIQVYRECTKAAGVVSAKIVKHDNHCNVNSQWSQRDLERSENTAFERNHTVLCGKDIIRNDSPIVKNNELLRSISPSGKLTAVIRKVPPKKGDEDKHFLEVWSTLSKIKNVDLLALEKHGKVYEDDQFGCLQWSANENKLLYVAEKKLPKTVSYFETKLQEGAGDASTKKEEPIQGDQFVFQDDWGEQLVSKSHPVLCVFDLNNDDVTVLPGVPEDISAGQAIWSPGDKGVVFVGWFHEPYRLGLIYCPIRRNALFHLDLESGKCDKLSSEGQAVRCPRLSPDSTKLVYLQNPQGGPHMQCSELVMYNWESKESTTVVPLVEKPGKDEFPGLFLLNPSQRCWSSDNKRVVLDTIWRSRRELVMVNTDTKKVVRLTHDSKIGSWILLDIHYNCMIAKNSAPNLPYRMVLGKLPAEGQETAEIKWTPFDSEVVEFSDIDWEIKTFKPVVDALEPRFQGLDYEAILLKPSNIEDKSKPPPMIVWPHGGPHSVLLLEYSAYTAALCRLGFSVLLVNYRGSFGFGQASILSLPGNVGCQDVHDVQNAVSSIVAEGLADEKSLVLCGGSHGGFLVTHLIGQFPGKYKACVARNPVTNMASMLSITDIPDWVTCESGFEEFEHSIIPSPKMYEMMFSRSPIQYVDKVETPTMIMLGEVDRRVPPKQGHEYYKALKTRGVEVRLLVYPNNSHPINKVDAEADAFVNIYKWYMEHLNE
ncbi:acylamino-acid-releasing enzyme-like [Glandiceps talaboti]